MKTYSVITSAFLVTFFAVPVFRWLAIKSEILDLPGGRKIHKIATPLLGGVAIYFGFIIATILGIKDLFPLLPLLGAATAILILGLINDIRPLSAKTRFFYQLLAALALIFTGVRISFLPSGYLGDSIEVLITALWLVGVTNAYNYLDGLDGLASGSAAINLFCFAIILYTTKQYALGRLALILAAAALGFLPHNFLKKGKIFLGEAGSTFLGFMLAGIAIIGNWAEDNIVKLSIPILVLGVPIFDMIFTTIIRIREKKVKNLRQWLEYSDRDHFHYSLVELGLRPSAAVFFIYLITLSIGISAIMVSNDVAIEGFLSLFQASIIISVIAVLIVIGKKHQNGWSR